MAGPATWARAARAVLVVVVIGAWAVGGGSSPARAAAAELPPLQPVSGSFFDLQIATLNPSLAVDAAGGEHMAIDRPASSGKRVTYAFCPGTGCVAPDQWAQVDVVPGVPDTKNGTQLRLTPSGKPRLLVAVAGTNDLTTFRYAACDSACTTAGGWSVVDLGSLLNKPGDIWGVYKDSSFALDPQGRPRFVYSFQDDQGVGRLYYAACDTGCATSVANWTKTTVSQGTGAVANPVSVHYESLSLDFTGAGQPRVAGHSVELPAFGSEQRRIAYLECSSACSAPEPSPPPNPNWKVVAAAGHHGHSLILRLDNNDQPRILVAGQEDLFADMRWLRCATACTTAANWSSSSLGISGSDPDLVFDGANRPQAAFKGDVGGPRLGYVRCHAGCDAAAPSWQVQQIADGQPFHSSFSLEGSCAGRPPATWLVGYRASVALDGTGSPRVGYVGYHVRQDCAGRQEANGVAVRLDRFNAGSPPATGGRYTPLTPARILDTRTGTGGFSSPVGPGATIDVQVTGQGGIPATGVSAVALNVTVTSPSAQSFLTLFPTGTQMPVASNLNYTPGKTVPNLVVVKVGTGGKVSVFNQAGTAHVIFDVAGFYSESGSGNDGRYTAVVPARILDTRIGTGGGVRLGPGASLDLQVSGQGGIPATGASAAVLNLAVTGTTQQSWVTVYPTGQPRPLSSNVNFEAGDTVANRIMAKLGAGGKVTIYNEAGDTDVVVDVGGWFTDASQAGTSGRYTALDPARILDTRLGVGGINGPLAAGSTVDVQVTGRGGVPATGVSAVILNATVTEPEAGAWITVFPAGAAQPLASDLNFAAGETRPNLVVVRLGTGGKVSLFTQAGAHVIFDVAGWVS